MEYPGVWRWHPRFSLEGGGVEVSPPLLIRRWRWHPHFSLEGWLFFRSWMWQSTFSYGVQLSKKTSVGVGFKLFHQRLADSATQVGSQEGEPYSTDFAFDILYLRKFG